MLNINRLYQLKQNHIETEFQWVGNLSVFDGILTPYQLGKDYSYCPETGTVAWVENSRFPLPSGWLDIKANGTTRTITFPSNGRLILPDKPELIELLPIKPIQYQESRDYLFDYDEGVFSLTPNTRIPFDSILRLTFNVGGRTSPVTSLLPITDTVQIEGPLLNVEITLVEGVYLEGVDYSVDYDAGVINILPGSRMPGNYAFINYSLGADPLLSTQALIDNTIVALPDVGVREVSIKAIGTQLDRKIGGNPGDYELDFTTGLITFMGRTPRVGTVSISSEKIQSTTYATPEDFSTIFEKKETLEITNLGNPEATHPDYRKLWEALEYASSEIDFRLNNFNRVPLNPVPAGIEWKCVVLARAFCDTAQIREGVQRDLEMVMQQLKELAEGKLSVPDLDSGSPSGRGNYGKGALDLTRQTLRGW